jgi:hypothetical protein
MLERTKGYHYETKSLSEREVSHIALNKFHSFAHIGWLFRQSGAAAIEHTSRAVEARDLLPRSRDRKKNPARTAANFQDFSVNRSSFIDVELDVGALAVERDVIVELAECFDVIVTSSAID